MIAAWMLYCVGVAALLALAAWALERALRSGGFPLRWAWVAGTAGAVALPPGLWLTLRADGSDALHSEVALLPVAALQAPLTFVAESSGEWMALGMALWLAWGLSSAALLTLLLVSQLDLLRQCRGWRSGEADGVPVLVSRSVGPAVVGFLPGRIVMPEWVLGADAGLRSMTLRHEQEHLLARDPLLVLLSLGALVLAPWNLPLWWMHSRLRQAIEIDCDRRVLQRTPGAREYGLVLLKMARYASQPGFAAAAFAQSSSHLGRRIHHLTTPREGSWARAVAFVTVAVALTTVACEVRSPFAPDGPTGQDAVSPVQARKRVFDLEELERLPKLLNAAEVMATMRRVYPARLREAGIGGQATVEFVIRESGTVDPSTIRVLATTREEFREPGAGAARELRFDPGQRGGRSVPVRIVLPLSWQPETTAALR
jgi:TonB family protein